MKLRDSDIFVVSIFIAAIGFYLIGLYVKCVASLGIAIIITYVDDYI